GQARLWIRHSDHLPRRITFVDENVADVQVDVTQIEFQQPWDDDKWQLHAAEGEDVQTTAVAHLVRFVHIMPKILGDRVEPLGPPEGTRELVATEGRGRLETIDGTHVLFLKGSP